MILALDWGNSNLRVAVLAEDGTVLRSITTADGAAGLSGTGFAEVLKHVRERLSAQALPALACGAVGAREGWREAPYVSLPAKPDAVARHLVEVPEAALHIVPGLCHSEPPRAILRGEETQLLGLGLAGGPSDAIVCLPGTHSKWVQLASGEVQGFRTYMTGELFALACRHTHLAADGDADDAEGFNEGLGRVDADTPLSASLFGLRADRILGGLPSGQSRAALAGLLIGSEVAHALAMAKGQPIILCGEPAMMRRYAVALARHGVCAEQKDGAAAAWIGLAQIARLAGIAKASAPA